MKKKLSDLFVGYSAAVDVTGDVFVSGIAVDSRLVQAGDVFVATSDRVDGHQYIPAAIGKGAVAVIGSQPQPGLAVPYVQVEDARGAMAHIAAALYDHPAESLNLIGVTGSDGKTTTSNLIFAIMQAAGFKSGMITTVNAVIGEQAMDTGLHVTTPEVFEGQAYMRQMVDAGLTHAVLETTSHGLAARRVFGKDFNVGVVTNITHEHLDYHGSYQAYFDAKARLFTGLLDEALAVLNYDDRSYADLAAQTKARQISYGLTTDADLYADQIENAPDALRFVVHSADFSFPVETSMIGNYNVYNCLAAIAATVVGLGVAPEDAQQGIKSLAGVSGRMQRLALGQDFLAIVDFAHTPFALQSVLEAGHKLTDGRIIAAFGSAGLRDKQKRRMMAEISAQLADLTILTAEDPRTESLDGILQEMAEGALSQGGVEGQTFWRIPDRGAALRFAVAQAQPGDLVFALGKGHEQSMCFIETEYPWDDRDALQAALAEHLGIDGPAMPYLPTQDE